MTATAEEAVEVEEVETDVAMSVDATVTTDKNPVPMRQVFQVPRQLRKCRNRLLNTCQRTQGRQYVPQLQRRQQA